MGDFTIRISARMTRTRGICRRKDGNIQIRLSWPAYKNHGWEETKQTIRHELIHVHQYVNYDEGDHGPTFKKWADKMDVEVYANAPASKPNYIVWCPECGHEWQRQRKSKLVKNADSYKCGCGHSGLKSKVNTSE